ncbi:phytase [Chitinimonas sp.]|uniref:phytase n=1 Tax=Chitinimonas sp. TaxID=1934313 RepID=UPI0035B2BB9D
MMKMPGVRAIVYTLLAAPLLAAGPAPAVPPQLSGASRVVSLDGAGWLAQDKKTLRWLSTQGELRALLKLRSEALDVRPDSSGWLVATIDKDQQRPQLLRLDAVSGAMERLPALPEPAFAAEALCLYRDDQQLVHLFVLGREGQAEQWLLGGSVPRKVRSLALPPGAHACRVDDGTAQLLVDEPATGLWRYPADAERALSRLPVLLSKPYGPLEGVVADFSVRHGQVRAIAGAGRAVFSLALGRADGRLGGPELVPEPVDALAPGPDGDLARTREGGRWIVVGAAAKPQARSSIAIVEPRVQTDPMPQWGDAADDPAIWVNRQQPAESRVLATNKKQGLHVYDMNGKERQFLPVGRINNVDLRQGVQWDGRLVDLAIATQRDDLSLVVFAIDGQGRVSEWGRVSTDLQNIYGVCVYQPRSGGLEVFVNDKDGSYQQIRLGEQAGKPVGAVVRRFKVASQPEGCVVDDRAARLFFGEEKRGLWTLPADADSREPAQLILPVGDKLAADVEGMGIYRGERRDYLLVSSQGADRYEVLELEPPFRHRGSFRVGINALAGIDASSETDGLELSSANLGPAFPRGMLVVQDGHKRLPDGRQNFKYIGWEDIERALALD